MKNIKAKLDESLKTATLMISKENNYLALMR